MSIEKQFVAAVKEIMNLSKVPNDSTLLQLYALYKQSSEGDVSDGLPIGGGIAAIAKYRARKKMKGMSKQQAMTKYCQLVNELLAKDTIVSEITSWQGRTILISGASRGIGQAMAVKFAKDGANLILLARTMHGENGSLEETADLVKKAGGKSIELRCDMREDQQITDAVEQGVAEFGKIDAVICNAGALFIAPFDQTPLKRFDLVHQVNVRGTFALCQAALPHLKKSGNGRVLILCPPISLESKWFKGTLAYTISKYSMSMMVLGLSAELACDNIAVNGLWPATTIDTAAVRYNEALGGKEMAQRSRTTQIVADAAHVLMSRENAQTGEFHTDESVLIEAGCTDFSKYAVDNSLELQIDYYL